MKRKYVQIACLILFASAVTVNGKISRLRFKTKKYKSIKSSSTETTSYTSAKITSLLALNKKNPGSPLINNRLGYLYYSIGKYKNAEYHYKRAIIYNAKNIEARLGLYLLSMANKNYAKAEAYCRKVRSIDNLNYYGNLYLVYARMAQYKYKKAESVCKKMLAAYPCDTTFIGLLKLNYSYQKQTGKARKMQTYLDMLK